MSKISQLHGQSSSIFVDRDWKGISPERSKGTTEMTYKALTLNQFYFIRVKHVQNKRIELSCISSRRKIYDAENDLHHWEIQSKYLERS